MHAGFGTFCAQGGFVHCISRSFAGVSVFRGRGWVRCYLSCMYVCRYVSKAVILGLLFG